MKKVILSSLVLLLVTACAKKPESIEASYISPTIYNDWSCSQLAEEQERLSHAYQQVAAQQNKARGNDIAGVILIGLPVSSLSGDNVAPQVANIKGQQQTIEQTMIRKNCSR
ncbi:hypothetical protein SAMN04488056_105114 [Cohaesibacter marisflavi]|uniref:Lipoprotein n=1 Tax=Cohaesibacter marisflavi TaxID=655353 RepID=A0A1I5GQE4_9HYPH|nr:hypothetical protein [Cohaesibacter marisflavi]SFO38139.1 hypothetical protein SAMN04488056_105114 [Cohaesibacter marisflavi]